MIVQFSSKRPLKERGGIPAREYPMLKNIANSTKQLKDARSHTDHKINNKKHNHLWLPFPPYKKCEPSQLGSHSLKSLLSWRLSPIHTALSLIDDPLPPYQRCWFGQTWPFPHALVPVHTWGCFIQLWRWSIFTLRGILFQLKRFMGLPTHLIPLCKNRIKI